VFRIDVEDGNELAPRTDYWYDDLRPGAGIAGDVPWEICDIGNDDRPAFGRSGAANARSEGDFETTKGALVRTDAQKPPWFYDAIEACPQMAEGVMNEGAHGRHGRDGVTHPIEDCLQLSAKLGVRLSLGLISKI
jgi:hypothetical protein